MYFMGGVTVNYLALFVSSLAAMFVGMVWFSPGFFGNIWMKTIGMSKADMEKGKKKMGGAMVLQFIAFLITAYVLTYVLAFMGTHTWQEALKGAFWVWLGFVATTLLGAVAWEGKSWTWYFIMVSHHLVNLGIMSLIITLWV